MMYLLPYLVITGIFAGLMIRWSIMEYLKEGWESVCLLYIIENPAKDRYYEEYLKTQSMIWIVLTFWEWDFRRFIICQTDVQNILDFFVRDDRVGK